MLKSLLKNFIKRDTLEQVFSCEFWEKHLFIEHLQPTASVVPKMVFHMMQNVIYGAIIYWFVCFEGGVICL